jgi:ubiquinone biosynthesis monooxygenase Coq7
MNLIDSLILQADAALRTLIPGAVAAARPSPAKKTLNSVKLTENEVRHASGLMRINHTGEVCAQALYQGQALTAKLPEVRNKMAQAAAEEQDHLQWCDDRLAQLNAHPSILNPLWYGMSFSLGAAAGLAGDKWSLGFVAETERQVCEHLQDHLQRLPEEDVSSKAIIKEMILDEGDHASWAEIAGGAPLPLTVRFGMRFMAQIMKTVAYRI